MPAASSRASCRREEERLAALKKEFNNGEPERLGNEQNYQKYLDRVAEMKAAIARKESDIAAHPARAPEAAAAAAAVIRRPPGAAGAARRRRAGYAAFDLLATMVAVVTPEGECVFANSVVRERARPVAPQHVARLGCSTGSPTPQVLREHGRRGQQQRLRDQPLDAQLQAARARPTARRCRCT